MMSAEAPNPPTVAVIGPGAIGTTIAAMLQDVDRPATLCGRTARANLELRTEGGSVTIPGPVLTDPAEVEPVDVVFLAVKSTQLDGVRPWLNALCGTDTVICVLQNGVEQETLVAPIVPGNPVLPAVVWFPAETVSESVVRLRGEPRLTVPDRPAAVKVVEALQGSRCAVEVAADFTTVAWRKLLLNAVAGLMVLSLRRGGMFSRNDVGAVALAYLEEALIVARAEGAQLDDAVPQQILDGLRATPADMTTSILADREAGRPLEWDIRNGVVQRLGRARGIPTPISDVIVPLLAAASDGPG